MGMENRRFDVRDQRAKARIRSRRKKRKKEEERHRPQPKEEETYPSKGVSSPLTPFSQKIEEQEQTLFNDLRQGPCKGNKKDLCVKEGVPLHFKIIV